MACGLRRWAARDPDELLGTDSLIDSPRNGFLLQAHIHRKWNCHETAVNPDDGYKIFDFAGNTCGVDGKILHPICRRPDDPDRVSDEILRCHFRHAVLYDVRGFVQPQWDFDFPPGSDVIGTILQGPDPARRMEVELATRLGPCVEWSEMEVD